MSTPTPPLTFTQMRALTALRAYSRDPFRAILAQWIDNGPSDEAIAAQAKKNPDRWAQGLTMLSKASGYSEKVEVDVSGELHHVHHLSDLELTAELVTLERRLAALPPPTPLEPPTAQPA